MSSFVRYAIYQTPRPGSALWSLASSWLGRDAANDVSLERPEVPALAQYNLPRMTAAPRFYGFHGTLKAPFEPAADFDEIRLRTRVHDFAARRQPFDLSLCVDLLGNFLALRPQKPCESLQTLHRDCVCEFDEFRMPIGPADLARRRRTQLRPEQDAYLLRWGYPHVFEHFRFHMTLTSRIACASTHETIRKAVAELFDPLLRDPVAIDGIALFAQSDRETPFRMLEWFPFDGSDHHSV